jgi:thioredoxin-like negative regulator of GroEL
LRELGRVEETVAAFLSLARDEEVAARVRVRAVEALGEVEQVEEAIAVLLSLARDEEVAGWVRLRAARALRELGRVEETVAAFLSLARDETVAAQVRERAAEVLGGLGRGEEAVAVLLTLTRDEVDGQVRVQAIKALGKLKKSTPEVIAVLEALTELREKPYAKKIREAARRALQRLEDK